MKYKKNQVQWNENSLAISMQTIYLCLMKPLATDQVVIYWSLIFFWLAFQLIKL